MPIQKDTDNFDFFDEFLDRTFGEGPIDPDNFDSQDAQRFREMKDRMQRINRRAKGSDRQAEEASRSVQPSCQKGVPSDPYVGPLRQTLCPTVDSDESTPSSPADLSGYKLRLPPDELFEIARTPLRKKLLRFLLEEGDQITSYSFISENLDISRRAAMDAINTLADHNILKKEPIRTAKIQGLKITILINKKKVKELLDLLTSHPLPHPLPHPTTPPLLDRETEKVLSIREKLTKWTDAKMAEWFPALYAADFRLGSLRQIIDELEERNKSLEMIPISLEWAEWELVNGKMLDKNGNPVASPKDWVFISLKTRGEYRRPKGYVDPQEEALRAEMARQEALRQKREELAEAAFQDWMGSLSSVEHEALEAERNKAQYPKPEGVFFREVWKRQKEQPGSI